MALLSISLAVLNLYSMADSLHFLVLRHWEESLYQRR
jgi:hypothetical protein